MINLFKAWRRRRQARERLRQQQALEARKLASWQLGYYSTGQYCSPSFAQACRQELRNRA